MTSPLSDRADAIADVRQARLEDGPAILRMMEVFNGEEEISFTPDALARSYESLIANPGWGRVFIAEVGGVPAGYAIITYSFDFEFGGRDAFLTELFVARKHRKKGIGRTLLVAVERHALDEALGAIHLIVRRENNNAQVLYRRNDFQFDPRMLMTKLLPR